MNRIAPLVIAALVLAVVWTGRVAEGRRALADAEAAQIRGDAIEAILAARTAATARCPGCAAPDAAFAKLETMAKDAELHGDDVTAFAAWRAIRSAVLATDSGSPRRAQADAEVARFAHRLDVAATVGGAAPVPAAAEDKLKATLSADPVPDVAAYGVLAAGAALFVVCAIRFARAKDRRLDAAGALAGIAVAAAGAAFF